MVTAIFPRVALHRRSVFDTIVAPPRKQSGGDHKNDALPGSWSLLIQVFADDMSEAIRQRRRETLAMIPRPLREALLTHLR